MMQQQKMKQALLSLLVLMLPLGAIAREVSDFGRGWTFRKGTLEVSPKDPLACDSVGWEAVSLPHTWNAKDMLGYRSFYQGPGVYRKLFRLDPQLRGKRLFLRFEGVGAVSEVYVNGRLVCAHRGAYGAFVGELTGVARYGSEMNVVVVKADNKARPDVIPVNHTLFGVYGGIYRPVSFIVTEPVQIAVADHAGPGVYIRQKNVSRERADLSVRVKVDNATLRVQPIDVVLSVLDSAGSLVAQQTRHLDLTPQGTQQICFEQRIERPHLWQGLKGPYLYRVVVAVQKNGVEADRVEQPLGLRRYELIAGRGFYLNGERYPLYGVTRHQDWQGYGSALAPWQHRADVAAILDLGATTVRLAHYQQSDYVYSLCDSAGLIVWAEIPFVNQVTGQEWDNAHQQLLELIRQCYNHPSIYLWGLHNEVYNPTPYCAALTASLHDLARQEDPDRLTVSTNGYGTAEHPVNQNADVQAMNRYFGWYEGRITGIAPWIEGLEKKYPWQRLMLSEYGADANLEHQTEDVGLSQDWTKPWYPEAFQTRLHEYQWSVIEAHPYILASYLWNTFDFATPMANRGGMPGRNMKGLITFDRKTKKDAYFFYKASWSREPVLYLTQRRNTRREHGTTRITVYSNRGEPTVTLNGHKLKEPSRGYTRVQYHYDGVQLRKGRNVVRATLRTSDGRRLSDEVVWQWDGTEHSRGRAGEQHDQAHGSFDGK